jgi:hypothetical protein
MGCDVGVRELCIHCDGYSALEPEGKKRITGDHAEALRDGFMVRMRAAVTRIR